MALREVPGGYFANGRDDLPWEPCPATHMVQDDLVDHESEERRQRFGATTGSGPGQL